MEYYSEEQIVKAIKETFQICEEKNDFLTVVYGSDGMGWKSKLVEDFIENLKDIVEEEAKNFDKLKQ